MRTTTKQDVLDESLLPVYAGRAPSGVLSIFPFVFVMWDYYPTWYEAEQGIPKHRIGDLHILGSALDGDGRPMTQCGCIARHSETAGIDEVYYGVEAFEFSVEHDSGVCVECLGRLGRHLLLTYRHHMDLLKAEIPKWAALAREDNLGAVSGVTSSSKPKQKHRTVRVVEGHER
jgi:hypothetical protein